MVLHVAVAMSQRSKNAAGRTSIWQRPVTAWLNRALEATRLGIRTMLSSVAYAQPAVNRLRLASETTKQ